ncbi:MAG: SDR family oxidoreductase [Methylocystaceae bacterium]|nr:SDR family oxidoreductase [Methylocystaceae bacterium]
MKTVLISGASSDIGLAVCQQYLDNPRDYFILAHYRTMRPEFEKICKNSAVYPIQIDFSSISALEKGLNIYSDKIASSDVFINLAANYPTVSFDDVTAHDVLNALQSNLLPGIMIMQIVGPKMVERGYGRIVHASSIGVKFGGGEKSYTYSLSKHALEFIPSICRSWAKHNVFTNIVRIGVTDTRIHLDDKLNQRCELIPAGRAASVQEMAKSIIWFASEDNSYISNEVISVAGGE